MKVRELITKLQEFDQDALVVMSIDEEGNRFNPLADDGFSTQMTYKDGETGFAELTLELVERGYAEEDVKEGEPCVILWP